MEATGSFIRGQSLVKGFLENKEFVANIANCTNSNTDTPATPNPFLINGQNGTTPGCLGKNDDHVAAGTDL